MLQIRKTYSLLKQRFFCVCMITPTSCLRKISQIGWMCASMCVCVWARKRERERETKKEWMNKISTEWGTHRWENNVCVWVGALVCVCVWMHVCVWLLLWSICRLCSSAGEVQISCSWTFSCVDVRTFSSKKKRKNICHFFVDAKGMRHFPDTIHYYSWY